MSNQVVKDVANNANSFFDALQSQQQTFWGENQTALNALSKAWAPVLSSGVVPYGFSKGLDSLLQANVIDTGATASSNAINAAALQEKQASGGANISPTGSNEAINAEILARGQQSTAQGLQNEKIAGYKQGLANLEGATNAEMGIIDATNPAKAAEAATQAGSLAETAGNAEFEENQQTGPMAIASSITGDFANVAKGAASLAGAGLIPGVAPSGQGGGGGSYHSGGVVPGKKGEERTVKVLAGEYIIPPPKNKKRKSLLDKVLANA